MIKGVTHSHFKPKIRKHKYTVPVGVEYLVAPFPTIGYAGAGILSFQQGAKRKTSVEYKITTDQILELDPKMDVLVWRIFNSIHLVKFSDVRTMFEGPG